MSEEMPQEQIYEQNRIYEAGWRLANRVREELGYPIRKAETAMGSGLLGENVVVRLEIVLTEQDLRDLAPE